MPYQLFFNSQSIFIVRIAESKSENKKMSYQLSSIVCMSRSIWVQPSTNHSRWLCYNNNIRINIFILIFSLLNQTMRLLIHLIYFVICSSKSDRGQRIGEFREITLHMQQIFGVPSMLSFMTIKVLSCLWKTM